MRLAHEIAILQQASSTRALRALTTTSCRLASLAKPKAYAYYLDRVVARGHFAILHVDVRWWMCELALLVGTRALTTLKLATHFQLQPTRVLHVHEMIEHSHNVAIVGGRCRVARRQRTANAIGRCRAGERATVTVLIVHCTVVVTYARALGQRVPRVCRCVGPAAQRWKAGKR